MEIIFQRCAFERPPKPRAAKKYYNPENNEMAFPSGHSSTLRLVPVVLRNAEAMSVAYEYRYSKRKSPYRVAYFDLLRTRQSNRSPFWVFFTNSTFEGLVPFRTDHVENIRVIPFS